MARGLPEKYDFKKIRPLMFNMGRLGMDLQEIAKVFGVGANTISAYCKRHPELKETYISGKSLCVTRLKSKAVQMALEGNVEMLKFCIKNISDWRDNPLIVINQDNRETHVTNAVIVAPEDERECQKLVDDAVARINELRKIAYTKGDV